MAGWRAGDNIGLYEVMYPSLHLFTAIAETDCEIIAVEKKVGLQHRVESVPRRCVSRTLSPLLLLAFCISRYLAHPSLAA